MNKLIILTMILITCLSPTNTKAQTTITNTVTITVTVSNSFDLIHSNQIEWVECELEFENTPIVYVEDELWCAFPKPSK